MKITLSVFAFIILQGIYAQTGNNFNKGFYAGYGETLNENGLGAYKSYADPRKCQQTKIYNSSIEKNVAQKLYTDGYRCGVQQASKDIPKIEKQINSNFKNKQPKTNIQTNDINQKINEEAKKLRKNQELEYQQIQRNAETQRNKQVYNQQVLYQMQQKQIKNQRAFQQNISNTLNSLSNSLQIATYNYVKKELNRRENVAINFAKVNSNRIEKVKNLYSQIPSGKFKKNINGQFKGHLFIERKYSFMDNKELVTEIPCLIKVKNNQVTNVYPYGKDAFELELSKEMLFFSNGIVKYTNFNTLETTTIVLIEPYLSKNPKQYNINKKGYGFITLYTTKKKDEGKIVWLQEIDKKGNIQREISNSLVYAKNEKELSNLNVKAIPINTERTLYLFGEPVQTPYGRFPLFMKTSKSDTKPLKDKEKRNIKIKKYRD